jgi:hypothetical protein
MNTELQGVQEMFIFLTENVFIKGICNGESNNRGALKKPSRPRYVAVTGTGVQVNVHPLMPFVLHPGRKQLIV